MFKAVNNFLNNSEKKVDTVDPEAPVKPVETVEVKVDKEPFSLSQMFFKFFANSPSVAKTSENIISEAKNWGIVM